MVYSLNQNFSGGLQKTVGNGSAEKTTLTNLQSGKTYYVNIRAYKKVGKTIYYSAWTTAKKVKVK